MTATTRFRLTRWFALLCVGSLALVAVVSATLLSRLVAERMLHRTGEVTMGFVLSLIRIHDGASFFDPANGPWSTGADLAEIERVFGQVARIPDVVHANLYDRERTVVWSTNRDAIGRRLPANPDLAKALEGALVVESGILDRANFIKPEHVFLPGGRNEAVENYVPVRGRDGNVVGVVELYMSPRALVDDVRSLTRVIWLGSLGAAALLFMVLLGIVRRGDALIRAQQRQLVEAESLAAIGEMASAVAHGIRNPLASIRSGAQLVADDRDLAPQFAPEIVRQADRLDSWVRRLLAYAYQSQRAVEAVAVNDLVRVVVDATQPEFERHAIEVAMDLDEGLPGVLADRDALEQALINLVSNAVDAMPEGGRLTVSTRTAKGRGKVDIVVADTGVGMTEDRLASLFQPFRTSKSAGLGLGLATVKRTVERLGGSIGVASKPGGGSSFTLTLPGASR